MPGDSHILPLLPPALCRVWDSFPLWVWPSVSPGPGIALPWWEVHSCSQVSAGKTLSWNHREYSHLWTLHVSLFTQNFLFPNMSWKFLVDMFLGILYFLWYVSKAFSSITFIIPTVQEGYGFLLHQSFGREIIEGKHTAIGWVFVSSAKFICWNLISSEMVFGGGAFGKCLGHLWEWD